MGGGVGGRGGVNAIVLIFSFEKINTIPLTPSPKSYNKRARALQ